VDLVDQERMFVDNIGIDQKKDPVTFVRLQTPDGRHKRFIPG
jgi:hypothetical protein